MEVDFQNKSSYHERDSSSSSPEYIPKPKPKQPKETTTKAVEVDTLPLAQYLPLGCFQFQDSSSIAGPISETNETWVAATEFLPEVPDPSIPWKSLVELWRSHWVRIFCSRNRDWNVWRIFLLPDDVARGAIDRSNTKLRKALGQILEAINISPTAWNGKISEKSQVERFDVWAAGDDSSLFYMFNTLPSPAPSLDRVNDHFARIATHEILDGELRGLTTSLYPYQRRSAAMMLQREVAPQMELDPRLETRVSPTGITFYYGARDRVFLQSPRFYDSVRGGILAETMGLGKTLMCIALVLATKGHWPKIPLRYSSVEEVHPRVNSLVELSAATVAKHGIPWRKVFDDMKHKEGLEMTQCIQAMERQVPTYEIPPRIIRSNRSSTISTPPEQVRLCSGTIIVVPRNLVHQWQSELSKHVKDGTLKVLVMISPKTMLPSTSELATYDVVLFSRARFESEAKKTVGDDMDWYNSPLKTLHWLRIIIDEGHSFSSGNTNAAVVAERLVRAERRWIVSGTPAKDLLGVEVEMEAMTLEGGHENVVSFRQRSLEQRKDFSIYQELSSGAVKSIGLLASNFLKAEPWAGSVGGDGDTAKWDDYIYRHEGFQTRTHTSFSTCFRRTLENLVIKTRPEDVERDIELPLLSHNVVRLEPSFPDKISSNLFVLLFSSNAVTSERTDVDYLFHKGSSTHLHRLISNLRQSGFYWTGFNAESVSATLDVTSRYLSKSNTNCTREDRNLLSSCIESARIALRSSYWSALSTTEEMGIFFKDWPKQAIDAWAYEDCTSPVMMGLTQAVQAQKYVNNHLSNDKPSEGLAAAGLELRAEREQAALENHRATVKAVTDSQKMEKQSIPSSNFHTDKTRLSASGVSNSKSAKKASKLSNGGAEMVAKEDTVKPKRGTKRRLSIADTTIDLAPNTELGRTCVTGTTSRKFSYLIDRILELHQTEKILVFFDANYQAFYISQILDLFNIKHLIYANTLDLQQRGKYIVLYNSDAGHRVLLMDMKQAAHGLNLSSASRVFFLNPVCRPGIEAQAIKRAHRIGQTRPVYVETLVLKGTVEEAIHDRASNMTRYEHMQASKFLEDDATITRIIQQARLLPIDELEREGEGRMAPLKQPQQIFGRPGRGNTTATGLEKELFGHAVNDDDEEEVGKQQPAKKRAKRETAKARSMSDRTSKGKQPRKSRARGGNVQDVDGAPSPDPTADADQPAASGASGTATLSSSVQTYNSIFGGG